MIILISVAPEIGVQADYVTYSNFQYSLPSKIGRANLESLPSKIGRANLDKKIIIVLVGNFSFFICRNF
jgi:hypothetical protein